ncbi:hypothetical protein [Azospirillum argentinense]
MPAVFSSAGTTMRLERRLPLSNGKSTGGMSYEDRERIVISLSGTIE